MEIKEILSKVDHTLLKPESTWEQIKEICDDGIKYETASVCIPPSFVKQAADYITTSVDEDGIYNALVHYNVIPPKK